MQGASNFSQTNSSPDRFDFSTFVSTLPFPRVSDIMRTWDTSLVDDFSLLFSRFPENGPDFFRGISNWNTSNVRNLDGCFSGVADFNVPLNWNTSNVTSMNYCFAGCTSFNQRLEWNTSNVTSLFACFSRCMNFNQAINWDMSKVTDMSVFLDNCSSFNNGGRSIDWNLPQVTKLNFMFKGCRSLHVPITLSNLQAGIDVSSIVGMPNVTLRYDNSLHGLFKGLAL